VQVHKLLEGVKILPKSSKLWSSRVQQRHGRQTTDRRLIP